MFLQLFNRMIAHSLPAVMRKAAEKRAHPQTGRQPTPGKPALELMELKMREVVSQKKAAIDAPTPSRSSPVKTSMLNKNSVNLAENDANSVGNTIGISMIPKDSYEVIQRIELEKTP